MSLADVMKPLVGLQKSHPTRPLGKEARRRMVSVANPHDPEDLAFITLDQFEELRGWRANSFLTFFWTDVFAGALARLRRRARVN